MGWGRERRSIYAWSRAVPQPLVLQQGMLKNEVLLVKDEGADGEWRGGTQGGRKGSALEG